MTRIIYNARQDFERREFARMVRRSAATGVFLTIGIFIGSAVA